MCWAHKKREQRAAARLAPIRPYREPLSEKLTRYALRIAEAEEDLDFKRARQRLWEVVYRLARRMASRRTKTT